jgi:hypothetical protein
MQTQLGYYEQLVAFDAFILEEKNPRLTEYVSERSCVISVCLRAYRYAAVTGIV